MLDSSNPVCMIHFGEFWKNDGKKRMEKKIIIIIIPKPAVSNTPIEKAISSIGVNRVILSTIAMNKRL